MREHDEDEEEPEADGRHDEEVGGHDLAGVIGQKRAPALRRSTQMPSHVLRHGRLTHRDPQLQELAANPRGTPQGIRRGHVANRSRRHEAAERGVSLRQLLLDLVMGHYARAGIGLSQLALAVWA